MFNHVPDNKLFFDPAWYEEQILNSPTKGENNMSDNEEKIGSGDIKSESDIAEDEEINPCFCCEDTECRLHSNKWADD